MKLLVADEGSGALVSFEKPVILEFAVSANDGVRVDLQVDGELPNRGQLIAASEVADGDRSADLIYDLPVYGHAAVHVEVEAEGGFLPGTHVY